MEAVHEYRIRQAFIPFVFSGLGTGIFLCLLSLTWNIPTFTMGFLIGTSVFTVLFLTSDALFNPIAKKLNMLVSVILLSFYYVLIIYLISVFYILVFNLGEFQFLMRNLHAYIYNHYILLGLAFGLSISLLVNFYIAINTLLGPGTLFKMMIGKYKRPRIEKRFILSIDVKSSTKLAEELGPKKFLAFLNDFFYDLSKPVVLTKGEIYKYIGDEAIISWKEKRGKQKQNPLQCIFLFSEQLNNKKHKYLTEFAHIPEFRAALHFGEVISGEMGYIRKEISFLGDVLNTTSRILEECKRKGIDLLMTDNAWDKMEGNEFLPIEVGPVLLRGKTRDVNLYTAQPVKKYLNK